MRAVKQAQEPGAAPFCDSCKVEMAWCHSELLPAENAVAHVFTCRICDKVVETRAPAKAQK